MDDHTILIVDDDEPTQKLLEALMSRQGLGTHVVSNGAQAIDSLRDGQFACVILDLMMPAVGGQDVINYLDREQPTVPVIVCTAAGRRTIETLDGKAVRAVVRKPFDIDELAAIVSRLLAEKRVS